jgi:hypothetical protein
LEEDAMSEVTRHEPGTFCWPELATSDAAGAKTFYAGLFGWTSEDMPAGPDQTYTMLRLSGKDVGALYAKGAQEESVPPHWNCYVSVESADETAKKAKELGGAVLADPFDVFDLGRMAVLQDPTGAVFCLWQPRRHIGARILDEPGALCWSECTTSDTEAAGRFYTRLFGWTQKTDAGSPPYTEFLLRGRPIGGMIGIQKERGDVPPHWLVYFAVGDCDGSAARAKELGGAIHVPPKDIEHVGRFAILADPQGAIFAVIRLSESRA